MDASISKFAIGLERGVGRGAAGDARPRRGRRRRAAGHRATPRWPELVDAMKAAGGRVRLDPFYRTDHYEKMMEAFRKGNVVAGALRAPLGRHREGSRPVMEWLVPRQKLGRVRGPGPASRWRSSPGQPGPSREQISAPRWAKAWDSVDNRMGQLVYDNLFWNRTAKDLAMASVRSVGWNLGTIREIPGGAIDLAGAATNGREGRARRPSHSAAYVTSAAVVVGMLGGARSTT
jgi:hypothetical protein